MDDEFTEFKSADPVHDTDLLDLSSSQPKNSPISNFAFSFTEGIPKIPSLKKKTFIFPLDLDLNPSSLLEIISTEQKPTPWSLIENIEGLNSLGKTLVENGRLAQALKCSKHAETLTEIQRVKEIKRIATERGDYETAIQYRNLISQLEKQLSSVEEIEDWLKDQKEETLKSLHEQVLAQFGVEEGNCFKEKFFFPNIQKSTDVEAAQTVMANAQQFIYIKKIMKDQQSVFNLQTRTILTRINEELCKGMNVIFKIKPFLSSLEGDEDLQSYLKGISEVYFIAVRIQKVLIVAGLEKDFQRLLSEIWFNWDEIKDIVIKSGNEGKNEAGEHVCGICLNRNKNLVLLCSSYFHATCINFWINRISIDPPQLNTGNAFD